MVEVKKHTNRTFLCVKVNRNLPMVARSGGIATRPSSKANVDLCPLRTSPCLRHITFGCPPPKSSPSAILSDAEATLVPHTSSPGTTVLLTSSPAPRQFRKDIKHGLKPLLSPFSSIDKVPLESSPGTTVLISSSPVPHCSQKVFLKRKLNSFLPPSNSANGVPLTSLPATTVTLSSSPVPQYSQPLLRSSDSADEAQVKFSPGTIAPQSSSPIPQRLRKNMREKAIKSFFPLETSSHVRSLQEISSFGDGGKSNSLRRSFCAGGKRPNKPAITQLVIDVSNRPTTHTCVECGMSYVLGVKEDDELHRKHHKWLIGRLEWPIDVETDTCSKVVWRDMNSLNSDRIIKLALDPQSLKRAKYKCRVEQLLEMVNFSLGAQELSIDQLQFSNLYIYLTESPPSISPSSKKRKLNYSSSNIKKKKAVVAAVCIAGRVDFAYQVVKRGNSDGDKNSDKAIDFFTGNGGEEDNLLKICDSGLYCSPDPQKVYIGIHRIWTSHDYRRLGFARRLLDSISKTFIYAVPLVDNEVRRKFIAFSQPTESGVKLATGWLKNPNFKVYIE